MFCICRKIAYFSNFLLNEKWLKEVKNILGVEPYIIGVDSWITLPSPISINNYDEIYEWGNILIEESSELNLRNQTIDYWKYEGANATTPASIQTTDVYDGANALEITNTVVDGEWKNQMISTSYPFAGDNTNPISVTISFWAKTSDVDPGSHNSNGDLKLIVNDDVSGLDRTSRALLTTGSWVYISKTFNVFPAAENYSLSLSLQFGRLEGVTQIDGITSSVSGGASLTTQDITINDTSILMYPNPATNILNYKFEGVKKIEVYDMLGQKLISEKAVGRVNISALTKGTYILKLMVENGSVSTKRFTKK